VWSNSQHIHATAQAESMDNSELRQLYWTLTNLREQALVNMANALESEWEGHVPKCTLVQSTNEPKTLDSHLKALKKLKPKSRILKNHIEEFTTLQAFLKSKLNSAQLTCEESDGGEAIDEVMAIAQLSKMIEQARKPSLTNFKEWWISKHAQMERILDLQLLRDVKLLVFASRSQFLSIRIEPTDVKTWQLLGSIKMTNLIWRLGELDVNPQDILKPAKDLLRELKLASSANADADAENEFVSHFVSELADTIDWYNNARIRASSMDGIFSAKAERLKRAEWWYYLVLGLYAIGCIVTTVFVIVPAINAMQSSECNSCHANHKSYRESNCEIRQQCLESKRYCLTYCKYQDPDSSTDTCQVLNPTNPADCDISNPVNYESGWVVKTWLISFGMIVMIVFMAMLDIDILLDSLADFFFGGPTHLIELFFATASRVRNGRENPRRNNTSYHGIVF
jgi:hypothetical protein